MVMGVLMGCTTSQRTPKPSLTIADGANLPKGCTPERVAGIVSGFFEAINQGDADKVLRYFGEGFQWYSAPAGGVEGHKVDSLSKFQELGPYFATRIDQREQMQLKEVKITGGNHLGGVDFAISINRTADDLKWGAGTVPGKGAVDCAKGTIMVWSLGAGAGVPDDR